MTRFSLMVAISLLCALPALAKDPAPTRTVRVIYLVSNDREERTAYTRAIEHAIRHVQTWYRSQLDGATFQLADPVVEVVNSNRAAAWFYANPAEGHKDDWGFQNTLAEAKRLLQAKLNDPNHVWVIYSDGPGDKGRGGNGVACMPENDLLGLVGRHPTEPDKLRWIAGLGHEIGHAFGLPHPSDTNRHADALMWTGIYGKYPDNTYLTDQDKEILMRSPFFYHADLTPVRTPEKPVMRFAYRGGAFEQHSGAIPNRWTESKSDSDATYGFREIRRDNTHVFILDSGRGYTIRLPIHGGWSSISTDGEKSWQNLYQIEAATVVEPRPSNLASRNLQYADLLRTAGVSPVRTITIGPTKIELSQPYILDNSHQIAVVWINVGNQRAIRVLYRSNSQCSWRMCDAVRRRHIGKGFHEYDKQVPIDVTLALLGMHDNVGELRPWSSADSPTLSQTSLAWKLLLLLTLDPDDEVQSDQIIRTRDGGYYTREYASTIPAYPVPFSQVFASLKTTGGGSVANPDRTVLPDRSRLPDFREELATVVFEIPAYKDDTGESAQMTARVYRSHDGSVKYMFVEDSSERVMLSGVELLTAPVSLLGVRNQYLDVSGMDTPLMEYSKQIPGKYGGKNRSAYQSAWPMVRELPIIQHFYHELGREIPISASKELLMR